jgi:hypothetical protein
MSISSRFAQRWLGPALFALSLGAANNAHADDGILTWIVKSISSNEDGEIIRAAARQVPQVGTALATGQQISTSAGQHMVLVNGRDLVEIQPNTTLTIGDSDSATPDANLDLLSGTVHVEVGKRTPDQTFSVGARYLVATVKGTSFAVNTSSFASEVSVTEGVVGVSSLASGQSVDVTAGGSAKVERGASGAPSLSLPPAGPTPAPSSTETPTNVEHASATSGDDYGSSGGVNSGGSDSGGSGGADSGGSSSDGSGSGGSDTGGSDSGSSDSGGGGLGGAVGGAAGAVGAAVGGAADAVGGAVGGATGAVGGAVGGSLGGAVSDVGGAVGGAVGGLGGAVGGAVGGLGKGVGGLLGGKK